MGTIGAHSGFGWTAEEDAELTRMVLAEGVKKWDHKVGGSSSSSNIALLLWCAAANFDAVRPRKTPEKRSCLGRRRGALAALDRGARSGSAGGRCSSATLASSRKAAS